MNNLKELKKKYEELGKEIERLEKEKSCKRWRAKLRENYYCVGKTGDIVILTDEFGGYDNFAYQTRNYFKTREEAQRHLDNINTYYELMDLAEELNAGKKIDWDNFNQNKYAISFDVQIKILHQTNCRYYRGLREIYCLDESFLKIALDKIGEERLESLFKEE